MTDERTLPTYVERGGEQTFAPPWAATGVLLRTFFLRCDDKALQAQCDRYLNAPTGGKTDYRPVLPIALLAFAELTHLQSTSEPDRNRGWVSERDVAFWFLTMSVRKELGIEVGESLSFFQPYFFVDQPQALCTGRETVGFPKELSDIELTGALDRPSRLSVTTNVSPSFGPSVRIEPRELCHVMPNPPKDGAPPAAAPAQHANLRDLLKEAWSALQTDAESIPLPSLKLLFNLVEDIVEMKMPCVFLKQFRDPADGSLACYQALVEQPIKTTAFRRGGLLPGRYGLTLAEYPSHPIAADLGLTPARCQDLVGIWMDFDFTMETGKVVWEARR